MHDFEARLRNRIQLTTDGHRVYLDAVESAFGSGIDLQHVGKDVWQRRGALTEPASDANLFVPSRQLEAHRALVGCVYGEAASQGPG